LTIAVSVAAAGAAILSLAPNAPAISKPVLLVGMLFG
jgi:hypothetical protein